MTRDQTRSHAPQPPSEKRERSESELQQLDEAALEAVVGGSGISRIERIGSIYDSP
ncbi:MAG: hypothetical protein ACRBN8_02120 [Nannocystales bacterium]